ncbi:ABC transporter ATP-binding protein [Deinococcus ruber]|uniref:HlyB/MsbA family ABC transporter n=1 Tax=Deinococcus ruber TaxID=1848197 RepID=A0A918CKI0_9DEIO|nr:ABC transporter ATP-binding protein [Deinococcus ruber]GGR28888.1 HlyB/MsbA family ABC transporter [Deinococcus ruber]
MMQAPPSPRSARPPGEAATSPGFATQLRDLRATLRLVWLSSPGHTSALLALSLLSAFLPAATLWATKLLIDAVGLATTGQLAAAGGYAHLVTLLALQVGVGALGSVLGSFQNTSRELLGDSLQYTITVQILNKAVNLEVEKFEDAETYDALQNAYREVGVRPLGVLTQLIALVQAVITLVSIGALMARLGPLVLPLVMVASIPGVIIQSRFGAENYRMLRRRTEEARIQNYLGSVLTSDSLVKEVRLFHFEPYLIGRWQEYYRKFRAQLVPLVQRRNAWSLGASLLSAVLVGAATLSVLSRAAKGQITVGDFSLFALGISQVQGQFSNLLTGVSGIYQNLLYIRNLFEFLELPARDLDAGSTWEGPIETIEFQDVSFRYPLTTRDVLKGVNFTVRRGQALALVGENGAGKTTIVKLLTRLFEPSGGRILLNGLDASQFSARSVQQEMSIIFQDFGQYQMTVRENVALSAAQPPEPHSSETQGAEAQGSEVARAGAQAGADEFIASLPSGYDTMLGRMFSGGRQLSGGQWQRLALARLYYRRASVLVFDEPTAALDATAEYDTISRLRAQAGERITVIISHRFSTVRLADQIVVLDGGRITESGSHAELVALDGRYAALYRLQASGYTDEETAAAPA